MIERVFPSRLGQAGRASARVHALAATCPLTAADTRLDRAAPTGFVSMHGYDRAMPIRLHRLTSRLGADLAELTPAHLQVIGDLRMPEDADLDFKGADSYTTSGPAGLDELAKDVTALANARGGLIIIGIAEDSQACAESEPPHRSRTGRRSADGPAQLGGHGERQVKAQRRAARDGKP